ncbi:MAG: hypothetical protein COA61_007055 [Zetaproteobacteria bacterium]|nr:hypothetical protein [Zetaproteobacteria bacterium]
MEKWNELCYMLSENLSSNVNEQVFEIKVIQAFEKLGWSEFNHEIVVRESIHLGAANRISPDLVLKLKESGNQFVVEVKKPSIEVGHSNFKSQLSSYMGIMRLETGLLIGNKIQIYLDGKLFNQSGIVLIDEIEFKRDNEKGLKFIQLFNKEKYSKQNIKNHAHEKFQQLKELEDFKTLKKQSLTETFQEKIINLLKLGLRHDYPEKTLEKFFEEFDIIIKHKTNNVETEQPNIKNERYISSNQFNPSNIRLGRITIGKYVRKTFSDLVRDNKINQDEIEKLQKINYSQETFHIQYPFLAKKHSQCYKRERYWKDPYFINGEVYFACSQWFEVPANNDRPYYERWLKKMKSCTFVQSDG